MMQVTFFGTAGSRPPPGHYRVKYGKDTSCVVVQKGPVKLVFDAGSGINNLGVHYLQEAGGPEEFAKLPDERDRTFHVNLTHYHPDHHEGWPFFPLAYNPAAIFKISGELKPDERDKRLTDYVGPKYVLRRTQAGVFFPVKLDDMSSHREYIHVHPRNELQAFKRQMKRKLANSNGEIDSKELLELYGQPVKDYTELVGNITDHTIVEDVFKVSPIRLHHPQGAIGSAVEDLESRTKLAILFDHEHGNAAIDTRIRNELAGYDAIVYDSAMADDHLHIRDVRKDLAMDIRRNFILAKHPDHAGWGHSTINEGAKLCEDADIPNLIGTHHEPRHADVVLDYILKDARERHPSINIELAVEGSVYEVGKRGMNHVGHIEFSGDKTQRIISDLIAMHGSPQH